MRVDINFFEECDENFLKTYKKQKKWIKKNK